MIRVTDRQLKDAHWKKVDSKVWRFKRNLEDQTSLQLDLKGEVVQLVLLWDEKGQHQTYYSGGLTFNRDILDDLPEDLQRVFRWGLDRIGML
jgi:hypothetical protein